MNLKQFFNNISPFKSNSKSLVVDPYDIATLETTPNTPWWGTFSLKPDQAKFWRVGEIIICLDHAHETWHIACCQAKDFDQFLITDKARLESIQLKNFAFRSKNHEIHLRPVLADRPLASQLARSVQIPANEEILLYVSSPVWVHIETIKPKVLLGQFPSFTLSDTWFGHNTIQGELCYAGQTYCSTSITECPHGPDRIMSPMLIKNRSRTTLALESISVPLPYLSVYVDSNNHLWTEQLNLIRESDDKPEVRVAKGPPKSSTQLHRLSLPRIPMSKSLGLKNLFHYLNLNYE